MKIYALLVGIDKYPVKPLYQCVKDVEKIEAYLTNLPNSNIIIKKLTDGHATKTNVIGGIQNFLSQATDDDIALFYYSGHGGQELSNGLFPEEHDGALECMVCHYEEGQTNFLLADKEIRYLFSKFKHTPHLVTVFDCCHAGDMVRGQENKESLFDSQLKRLAGYFDARPLEEFIFYDEKWIKELKEKPFSAFVPFKNHVHLAAAIAGQLAYEDANGGIFTNYLLKLLAATNGQLTYQEIAKWAKISLKDVTRKKQTPTITVQGVGEMTANTAWLNLHDPSKLERKATVLYHEQKGKWYYSQGQLMGIRVGSEVYIDIGGEKLIKAKVTSVNLEDAILDFDLATEEKIQTNAPYTGTTHTSFAPLDLFVNDLDKDAITKNQLEQLINQQEAIHLVGADEADFFVNVFNQMVYLSLPYDDFRPLGKQIDLLPVNGGTKDPILLDENSLAKSLMHQIKYLINWNHFDTLENSSNNFDSSPIQVTIRLREEDKWEDVTNSLYELSTFPTRSKKNTWWRKYQICVKNISNEKLYIGVLTLNSDLSITSAPYHNITIALEAGESKLFYDHKANHYAAISLDDYKEVYNWSFEWFHYKFIVSNIESFTTALEAFRQPSIDSPIIFYEHGKDIIKRTEESADDMEGVTEKWTTLKTTIRLKNPTYNRITGSLENLWSDYAKDAQIGPFIRELYTQDQEIGFTYNTKLKPNQSDKTAAEKSLNFIKIPVGNFWDNQKRKRMFLKHRRTMTGKPVIVAEGDSWFLFPMKIKDTIDHLMESYPVRSLAAAGATLEDYLSSGQLLKEVAEIRPKYVLISGGGNDIVGPEITKILMTNVSAGQEAVNYLNLNYPKVRSRLMEIYEYFFQALVDHESVKQIFVHGYDHIKANPPAKFIKNGWVNRFMQEKKIEEVADRERLIQYLINNFNQDLEALADKYTKHVTYVDMRGLIREDWADEIHPNDVGFKRVADKFLDAIERYDRTLSLTENKSNDS